MAGNCENLAIVGCTIHLVHDAVQNNHVDGYELVMYTGKQSLFEHVSLLRIVV